MATEVADQAVEELVAVARAGAMTEAAPMVATAAEAGTRAATAVRVEQIALGGRRSRGLCGWHERVRRPCLRR